MICWTGMESTITIKGTIKCFVEKRVLIWMTDKNRIDSEL